MTLTSIVLLVAILLCALVAGLVFTFAVVVMPGIARLGDREFMTAFREMDGVIQRGDPLFVGVWMGSNIALIAALVLAFIHWQGLPLTLVAVGTAAYLLGVQLPTFRVNVPLNNAVQAIDVEAADGATWAGARERFETAWNRGNRNRTVVAVAATVLLLVALVQV